MAKRTHLADVSIESCVRRGVHLRIPSFWAYTTQLNNPTASYTTPTATGCTSALSNWIALTNALLACTSSASRSSTCKTLVVATVTYPLGTKSCTRWRAVLQCGTSMVHHWPVHPGMCALDAMPGRTLSALQDAQRHLYCTVAMCTPSMSMRSISVRVSGWGSLSTHESTWSSSSRTVNPSCSPLLQLTSSVVHRNYHSLSMCSVWWLVPRACMLPVKIWWTWVSVWLTNWGMRRWTGCTP